MGSRTFNWAAYAANPPGYYAEVRVMPRAQICPQPKAISFDTAAEMMMKGMTAEYMFHRTAPHRTAPLNAGDTVLFHAAACSVGLIACDERAPRGSIGSVRRAPSRNVNWRWTTVQHIESTTTTPNL